jgi:hypothetical protein
MERTYSVIWKECKLEGFTRHYSVIWTEAKVDRLDKEYCAFWKEHLLERPYFLLQRAEFWSEHETWEVKQIEVEEKVNIRSKLNWYKFKAFIGGILGFHLQFRLLKQFRFKEEVITTQKLHLNYEKKVLNMQIRGAVMDFRARIVCDTGKIESKNEKKLDYFNGIKLLEQTTKVPKFYIERFLIGLYNTTKNVAANEVIKIDMSNINTKVEIEEGKFKVKFDISF